MAHYTLLSGVDTTTRTFKCAGCKRRLSANLLYSVETESKFNVSVCSTACANLADIALVNKVLRNPHDAILKDTFRQSGFDMDSWNAFIDFLWYTKHEREKVI